MELKDPKDYKVQKETLELKDLLDQLDLLEHKEHKDQLDLLDLPDLQQPPLSLIFANFTSSKVTIAILCLAEIRQWSLVVEAIAEQMV